MSFLRLCAAAALLTLAGCSTGIYREGGDEHGYWHLDGKLGIRSPQGADSVSLRWQQCGNAYRIRLNSLIGTHIASIDGDNDGVSAQFEDRPALQANSAEALIEQELGWTLPVGALQHWLRGQADTTPTELLERNPDGSLKRLRQGDWQVDYLRYHQADNRQQLPEKLRLSRRNSGSGDTTLTLIISNWRLGMTPANCLSE